MGQFANMLFSALLGWVQTAAAGLWGLVSQADGSAWLRFLADHWLPLTLMLCAVGVVMDFVIYLIRWQPYRVWRSFLHRIRHREEDADPQVLSPVLQRKWLYADGSTEVEDIHQPHQPQPEQDDRLEAPIRPVRRLARRAAPEQAYHQPVYPPQWQHNTQDQQGENE